MKFSNENNIFLGSWLENPYIAFAAGALVELVAYFVVHLVLDRWGRKIPFCAFVLLFGIVAFLVVPIQMFMLKNSPSRKIISKNSKMKFEFISRTKYSDVYN
jgi:hypothetical protein